MNVHPTGPNNRRLTVVASLLSMIAPFSMSTYMPSFPDIEMEFGITRAMLTQSIAVYLVAFAISTLFWGPLSDRFGRRLVVLYFALAPAIAPMLGGWMHDLFGWRSVFWFLAAFAGMFLYIAGAPTVIYDFLNLGSDDFAWLFLPIVVGTMLGAFVSNRLARRWSGQRSVSVGFAVMILASVTSITVANFMDASIPTVIIPLLLYSHRIRIDVAGSYRADAGLPADPPGYRFINAGLCANDGQCLRGKFCCATVGCPLAEFRTGPGRVYITGSGLVVSTSEKTL